MRKTSRSYMATTVALGLGTLLLTLPVPGSADPYRSRDNDYGQDYGQRSQDREDTWRDRRDMPGERRATSSRMSERDLRSFEDYLNAHDETAQELYRNPDLINDRQFIREHRGLHDWMESHEEAAATIQANPDKFLWRERTVGATDFLRQLLK
jgi:hypothetical protein